MSKCLDQNPPSLQCPGDGLSLLRHLTELRWGISGVPRHCQLFERGEKDPSKGEGQFGGALPCWHRAARGSQAQAWPHSIPGSPELPQSLAATCSAETTSRCPFLCGFEAESCFGFPGLEAAGATAWEVPGGVCWETANGQKLEVSCWSRKNGLEISPGPMRRVVFLCPSSSRWLSGQNQALTFVAVELGNCNLQDRFLPKRPRNTPWGIKTSPMPQPEGAQPPVQALAQLGGVSSTHPALGEEDWGPRGMVELAWGQGRGQEALRGGSCTGFSLHCCCSRDMFNCSSTAEIICRYECRPRGR